MVIKKRKKKAIKKFEHFINGSDITFQQYECGECRGGCMGGGRGGGDMHALKGVSKQHSLAMISM